MHHAAISELLVFLYAVLWDDPVAVPLLLPLRRGPCEVITADLRLESVKSKPRMRDQTYLDIVVSKFAVLVIVHAEQFGLGGSA